MRIPTAERSTTATAASNVLLLSVLLVASVTQLSLAAQSRSEEQTVLHRTDTNPLMYEFYYSPPYALPDQLTYPCQDYRAIEQAATDLRAAYGTPPVKYSTTLETSAVQLLADQDDMICEGTNIPPTWMGELNGTAVGLGWRASNRLKDAQSYKCVQALNYWAVGPAINSTVGGTSGIELGVSNGTAAWLIPLVSSISEVGCSMRLCTQGRNPSERVDQYVVYCLFSGQDVAWTGSESANQLLQQLPARPLDSCAPEIYITNATDSLNGILRRFSDRGLTAERLLCYHRQLSPGELLTEGIPLAIPCADADVSESCPELDMLSKGTAPGACPTVYHALPGDTMETIAAKFEGLSAWDLCCYNPGFNNSYYGNCKELSYLNGAATTIIIPCADDIRLRNCTGQPPAIETMMECPDVDEALAGINAIRSAYGLNNLTWNQTLADDMSQAYQNHYAELCAEPYDFESIINTTSVPSLDEFFYWSLFQVGPMTSMHCSPAIMATLSFNTEMASFTHFFKTGVDVEPYASFLAQQSVALLSNNGTSIGCALQVCDSYFVTTVCMVDAPVSTTSLALTSDLEVLPQPDCPLATLMLEGDTYEETAERNNVTLQELICFHGYAVQVADSDVQWAMGAPVVVPCPSQDPSAVTCEAYDVYRAETGDYCGFNYTVQPGESFEAIAARFPALGYGGCELCCSAGGNTESCSVDAGEEVYIACVDDLPEYDASNCACLASTNDGSNRGLILGLSLGIGMGLLLLATLLAVMVIKRRRNGKAKGDAMAAKSYLETKSSKSFSALSDNSWVLDPNKLQFIRQIGGGSFGNVYLGRLDDGPVAIKCMHERHLLEQVVASNAQASNEPNKYTRSFIREIQLMTQVRSPYTVLFLGVCLEPLACITEFCANGSLYDVLQRAAKSKEGSEPLPWDRRLRMALQGALGMQHLHNNDIVHRDLKSPNLLVDEGMRIKVGDFGLSVFAPGSSATEDTGAQSNNMSTLQNINRRWLAPEVAAALLSENVPRQPFSKAADVYAFGLVLLELATFKIPFHNLTDSQVFMEACQGTLRPMVPSIEETVDGAEFAGLPLYQDLMQACWAADAAKRPTFEEVIGLLREIMRVCKASSKETGTMESFTSSSLPTPASGTTTSSQPYTPHEEGDKNLVIG